MKLFYKKIISGLAAFGDILMFFRCTSNICGAKYESVNDLQVCPKCRNPTAPGLDFLDILHNTYEILED